MSDLSAFQHPRFAGMYERISVESEQRGTAEHRDRALAGLSGRVIEVGAGNGLNFGHYPGTVTEVLAVEPEDRLRALAEEAAATAPVPVRVVAGHADALPAQDATFDAAVASLVLCSVPDPAGALAEIRRVLRPGGQLRFFEHVRSANPLLGLAQDAITPLWSRVGGGCHPNRDTAAAIRAAGFHVEQLDRFCYAPLRFVPPHTHILGRARTPN
ncbi:MAG: class I SAM-dependent methyltransferase [Pseudonocardiales bacterium]|nr:class I SAM-dependent methyltransferase [Pseudonocardiales bacterium]